MSGRWLMISRRSCEIHSQDRRMSLCLRLFPYLIPSRIADLSWTLPTPPW